MKKKIIIIILIFMMLAPLFKANASDKEPLVQDGQCTSCRPDFQEHAITSFAFTYTSYMIYRKKLEMSKEAALFSSIATGLLLSYARDKYVFRKSDEDIGQYMKASAAGTGLSAVFTIVVPF